MSEAFAVVVDIGKTMSKVTLWQLVLLVDSSKFRSTSGAIVCELDEVDVLVTDSGLSPDMAEMVRNAGVELIIAD